jgi:DNA-binding beta-propeller fold protein YncE
MSTTGASRPGTAMSTMSVISRPDTAGGSAKPGTIYVVDQQNHRVQYFDRHHTFIGSFGSEGSDQGQLKHPFSCALNSTHDLFVVDTGNNRVQVFSVGSHEPKATFGSKGKGQGEFVFPWGIAIDADDNVYVTDCENHRVQIFDGSYRYMATIGHQGNDQDQFECPYGIAVDTNYRLFVCDSGNDCIKTFDCRTGLPIRTIGGSGKEEGQFNCPSAIMIDEDGGHIIVSDSGNARIQIFNEELEVGTLGNHARRALTDARCLRLRSIAGHEGDSRRAGHPVWVHHISHDRKWSNSKW